MDISAQLEVMNLKENELKRMEENLLNEESTLRKEVEHHKSEKLFIFEKTANIKLREENISAKENELEERTKNIVKKLQKHRSMDELENELQTLRFQVRERDNTLTEKASTVDDLERSINDLQYQIRRKSQNEAELKVQLELYSESLQILEESVNINEKQICDLKTKEIYTRERER